VQLHGVVSSRKTTNRVRRVEWIRTVLSVGVNQEYGHGQQPRVGDQVLEKDERGKGLEWKYQQTMQITKL